MRFLVLSDLHIGRTSSHTRLSPGECSAAGAWLRAVDLAIESQVDAVVVAGDLVDHSNRFYESRAPLAEGAKKLTEAEIPLVAVAGNHDFDVTPGLFKLLAEQGFLVHLLGVGGQWELSEVKTKSGAALFAGYSFDKERLPLCPLKAFPRLQTDQFIGICHGDIEETASLYGPLPLTAFAELPPSHFWATGHKHSAKSLTVGTTRVLNPGSPQALDPAESGPHGGYLVETSPDGLDVQFVSLSTLYYWNGVANLPADSLDDVRVGWLSQLEDEVAKVDDPAIKEFSIRAQVNVIGDLSMKDLYAAFEGWQSAASSELIGKSAQIDQLNWSLKRPSQPLDEIAKEKGALGLLAAQIQSIRASDQSQTHPFVEMALESKKVSITADAFAEGLSRTSGALSPEECNALVADLSEKLLYRMLDQRSAP